MPGSSCLGLWAVLEWSWGDEVLNEGGDEMSMSVSRDNSAEIDLQGEDEFHRTQALKPQKKKTLYKKIFNSRSTAPGGCYVRSERLPTDLFQHGEIMEISEYRI